MCNCRLSGNMPFMDVGDELIVENIIADGVERLLIRFERRSSMHRTSPSMTSITCSMLMQTGRLAFGMRLETMLLTDASMLVLLSKLGNLYRVSARRNSANWTTATATTKDGTSSMAQAYAHTVVTTCRCSSWNARHAACEPAVDARRADRDRLLGRMSPTSHARCGFSCVVRSSDLTKFAKLLMSTMRKPGSMQICG